MAVLWSPQHSQVTSEGLKVIYLSLTEHCPDFSRCDAVSGSEDVPVTDQSPATGDGVTAGDVPHEDQDHPGELVGNGLLTSEHSHLQVLLGPHPALAAQAGGLGGERGEEETPEEEDHL